MKYPEVRNYRDGSFVGGERPFIDVYNPSDGSVISRVPMSTHEDVDAAVASAERAFPGWSRTPIKERVQVFYESGQMEDLDVKSELKEGGETRVMTLSNPKRDIEKVAFTYRTLPNSKGEKADVALYGLKTGAEGDAYIKDDVNEAKREAREESFFCVV